MTEHNHQALTVAWFRAYYPHLAGLLFAIPNGGKRNPATAALLKAEGVLPGIPDLFLAVPAGAHHGLFVEMKTTTGAASSPQKAAMRLLSTQGYQVAMARGYEAAKAVIRLA
jgi:hypothetical protein